jgi:hypothetical protein
MDWEACRAQRADLALALRAAAHHGLGEGVCNHFSFALGPDAYLINPRGMMWAEVGGDDIVAIDSSGRRIAGRHEVEPTAVFIHAAVQRIAAKACVTHTHMPHVRSGDRSVMLKESFGRRRDAAAMAVAVGIATSVVLDRYRGFQETTAVCPLSAGSGRSRNPALKSTSRRAL